MSSISIRTDAQIDRALDELMAAGSATRSEVIRSAILSAARDLRRSRMRAESLALAEDRDERAEAQAVLRDMGAGSAW